MNIEIKVINDDCANSLPKLKNSFFNFIYIDPPYMQTNNAQILPFKKWNKQSYKNKLEKQTKPNSKYSSISRIKKWQNWLGKNVELSLPLLKLGGVLAISINEKMMTNLFNIFFDFTQKYAKKKYGIFNSYFVGWLIWKKGYGINPKHQHKKIHEFILIIRKNYGGNIQKIKEEFWKNVRYQKNLDSIIDEKDCFQIFSSNQLKKEFEETDFNFDCPKPIKLIEKLIETYSKKGDNILDFFGGSGTTAIACINTQRNCVLIEKNKENFEIIKWRLQQLQQKNKN